MKLRCGVRSYNLPRIGEICQIVVMIGDRRRDPATTSYTISRIPMKQMAYLTGEAEAKHEEVFGLPHYFALDNIAQKLHLWPIPDKQYTLEGYYYPPIKKF